MNSKLTIKRVPATQDNRVRVDSLPANSVFLYGSGDSGLYLLVHPTHLPYMNNASMRDLGKQMCVSLYNGVLCHIGVEALVLPIPGATILVPFAD